MAILNAEAMKAISFDKTIICKIEDNSMRKEGKYYVSNGSNSFYAFSDKLDYRKGMSVYVTIPEGDYNNQKIIIGEKRAENEKPQIFMTPFDNLFDMTGNILLEKEQKGILGSLVANNVLIDQTTKEKIGKRQLIYSQIFDSPYTNYDLLGIKADFKSLVKSAKSGDYGLEATIAMIDKDKTVDEEIKNKENIQEISSKTDNLEKLSFIDLNQVEIKQIKLGTAQMFGNPYNFFDYTNQELVFPIDKNKKILGINIYFYQDAKFKDINYEPLLCCNEYKYQISNGEYKLDTDGDYILEEKSPTPTEDDLNPHNLFVNNVYICLGYSVKEFTNDYIDIYTSDSCSYHQKSKLDDSFSNKKSIELRWVHLQDGVPKNMMNDLITNAELENNYNSIKNNEETFLNPPNYEIRWYKYVLGASAADEFSSIYWKRIDPETGLEAEKTIGGKWVKDSNIDNPIPIKSYQYQCFFEPDVKNQREMIKAIVVYNNSQGYYSNNLVFENEEEVPSHATIQFLNALQIYPEDKSEGNYLIYGQNLDLLSKEEEEKTRELSCFFDANQDQQINFAASEEKISGTDIENLVWYFPNQEQSMLILLNGDLVKDEEGNLINSPTICTGKLPVYKIRRNYRNQYYNNTVICQYTHNTIVYQTEREFTFGVAGTMGTEQTLVIDFYNTDNNAIIIDSSLEEGDVRYHYFTVRCYDNTKSEIIEQNMEGKTIKWGWKFQDPSGKLAILSGDDCSEVCLAETSGLAHNQLYILQVTVGDLITYFPIPLKNVDCSYLNGPTQIIYQSDGYIDYQKIPYSMVYNDGNKEEQGKIGLCGYKTIENENYFSNARDIFDSFYNELFNIWASAYVPDTYELNGQFYWPNLFEFLKKYEILENYNFKKKDNLVSKLWFSGTKDWLRAQLKPLVSIVNTGITVKDFGGEKELSEDDLRYFYEDKTTNPYGMFECTYIYTLNNNQYSYRFVSDSKELKCLSILHLIREAFSKFYYYHGLDNSLPTRQYFPNKTLVDEYFETIYNDTTNYTFMIDQYNDIPKINSELKQTQYTETNVILSEQETVESIYYPTINKNNELIPLSIYVEEAPVYGIVYQINEETIWTQPILVLQNRWASNVINKWDGKTLEINKDEGYILSNAFAAGKKEKDNSFSGVMLGDWSRTNTSPEITKKTGIYGFHKGSMSYAFKEDGTAFIGKSGFGRINFDGEKSTIYSEGYSKGQGMCLDLNDPFIHLKGLIELPYEVSLYNEEEGSSKTDYYNNIFCAYLAEFINNIPALQSIRFFTGGSSVRGRLKEDNMLRNEKGQKYYIFNNIYNICCEDYYNDSAKETVFLPWFRNIYFFYKNELAKIMTADEFANKLYNTFGEVFNISNKVESNATAYEKGFKQYLYEKMQESAARFNNFCGEIKISAEEHEEFPLSIKAIESSDPDEANYFKVAWDGTLYAKGGEFEGKVNALSGKIGQWNIETDRIVNKNSFGEETLILSAAGSGRILIGKEPLNPVNDLTRIAKKRIAIDADTTVNTLTTQGYRKVNEYGEIEYIPNTLYNIPQICLNDGVLIGTHVLLDGCLSFYDPGETKDYVNGKRMFGNPLGTIGPMKMNMGTSFDDDTYGLGILSQTHYTKLTNGESINDLGTFSIKATSNNVGMSAKTERYNDTNGKLEQTWKGWIFIDDSGNININCTEGSTITIGDRVFNGTAKRERS